MKIKKLKKARRGRKKEPGRVSHPKKENKEVKKPVERINHRQRTLSHGQVVRTGISHGIFHLFRDKINFAQFLKCEKKIKKIKTLKETIASGSQLKKWRL